MSQTLGGPPDQDKSQHAPNPGHDGPPSLPEPTTDKTLEEEQTVFSQPVEHSATPGESPTIDEPEAFSRRRSGLLDLVELVFKRQELAQLHRANEILAKYNHQLHQRVERDNTKVYHAQHRREHTDRQVRDLWISATMKTAQENLVADYVRAEEPILAKRVMLVPDPETAANCNRLAQENRIDPITFDNTEAIAHDRTLFYVGDRVQFFRAEDRDLGVKDGDLGEIIAISPPERTLAVALDRCKMEASQLVLVPLREYPHIDLGYATTYDRTHKLSPLYHSFVLADLRAPTRHVVDSLSCFHVEIYGDALTACTHFPELAGHQVHGQGVDLEADPLAEYRNRT
jgi:hypothetical protein